MNNGASRVSLRQHNPICAYLRLSRVNGGAYKSEGIRAPPEGRTLQFFKQWLSTVWQCEMSKCLCKSICDDRVRRFIPYAAREEVPSKSRNLYGAQAIQICELAFLVLFCQQKLRFCQHSGAIFFAK